MAAGLGSTWWQYLLLFLAVAASWAGVPFIGTAALGAAAVAASQRRLDLAAVIVVAVVAGEAGGLARLCHRPPLGPAAAGASRPAPARAGRSSMERGERLYARWGWLAVFVTPAIVSGTAKMPAVPVRRLEPAGLARVDGVGSGQRLRGRQARHRPPRLARCRRPGHRARHRGTVHRRRRAASSTGTRPGVLMRSHTKRLMIPPDHLDGRGARSREHGDCAEGDNGQPGAAGSCGQRQGRSETTPLPGAGSRR